MSALATVVVNGRAARRLRQGHVWIFDSDVRDVGDAQPGDVVRIITRHKSGGANELGIAFFNPKSMIRLRLIQRKVCEPDMKFWKARLASALALRKALEVPGPGNDVGRLVFSEADGIPGLIVDKYADVLVIQTLSAGADRLLELWLELLDEMLSPKAIVERNDTNSRKLEGLAVRSQVVAGKLDAPVLVHDGGLEFEVSPLLGQKTGYFLDQRENRIRAADYAFGRCLDVFCYQGGFGLQLARGGAEQVVLVDQSARSLQMARDAAERNDLIVKTIAANAFDFLRDQQVEGEKYDLVVLDPPAFAKNKNSIDRAARGYKEINLRALKLLKPGGILISSSCSYHMSEEHFDEIILSAGMDAGRTLQVLERRSQARDHPVRMGFPESHYLKCFVIRAL